MVSQRGSFAIAAVEKQTVRRGDETGRPGTPLMPLFFCHLNECETQRAKM